MEKFKYCTALFNDDDHDNSDKEDDNDHDHDDYDDDDGPQKRSLPFELLNSAKGETTEGVAAVSHLHQD